MTKLTKISATALFALFLTACDKPANKTAEATPTAQTISTTAEEMAQGKADLQKIVAWDNAQKEVTSKARQFLQEKIASQDSKQIIEALDNFTKQITNVSLAKNAHQTHNLHQVGERKNNIMTLTEFLIPDNIHLDAVASCKKRALEIVGKMMADAIKQQNNPQQEFPQIEEETDSAIACFNLLFKREKLGCTGLNNGVALPHAKLPVECSEHLDHPIAIFIKLDTPIDYGANDKKEVDLIYAMMFPESCCAAYKDRLEKIAQKLNDKNIAKQLRAAQTVEEIWQIFEYADSQNSEQETA